MRIFVFVNQVHEIGFRQTTALLIAAFARLDHEVYLANVDGLSVHCSDLVDPLLISDAIKLEIEGKERSSRTVAEFVATVPNASFQTIEIGAQDTIVIRTNPGRDLSRSAVHSLFLESCQIAKTRGVRVINDPDRLSFFASKAAISVLPEKYRPKMLVTNNPESAANFIRNSNDDFVVKPLQGSRGENVIRVDSTSGNLKKMLSQYNGKSLVVQQFIRSDELGDKRVVVLNGRLLEHDEHIGGIQRVPAEGDFRANLHAGGTARPLRLTYDQRESALAAAAILQNVGIQLAGIDLIGNKVIEFNVFSTGGLYNANEFSKFDFTEMIARDILDFEKPEETK